MQSDPGSSGTYNGIPCLQVHRAAMTVSPLCCDLQTFHHESTPYPGGAADGQATGPPDNRVWILPLNRFRRWRFQVEEPRPYSCKARQCRPFRLKERSVQSTVSSPYPQPTPSCAVQYRCRQVHGQPESNIWNQSTNRHGPCLPLPHRPIR